MVWWLRLSASPTGGPSSVSVWRTKISRSCKPCGVAKKKKKSRGVSEQEKTWGLHPDLDVPHAGVGDWEEEQSEVYNCTLKNVIRI